jgi:hypothetical protein
MTKNNLSVALLAGLAGTAGMVGVSDAVNINADGIGEALIYPYYTTRKDQFTIMSVVNTTDQTKAVKVRFLEGKASAEVLDFNLYLSPFDVWTATISDNDTGAQIGTTDTSCTVPSVLGKGPVAFRNFVYEDDAADDASLNRTREGYVEVIEMGSMDPESDFGELAVHNILALGEEGPAIPLDWNGSECATYENLWNGGYWETTDANTEAVGVPMAGPQGGLFGSASVVNVTTGTIFGYNATAMEDWRAAPIHSNPGDLFPRIADADPDSIVFDNGVVVSTDFSLNTNAGADAVSSILMHDAVLNEYALDEALLAQTDWVFTFPTKRFYVPADGSAPSSPFTNALTPAGACEPIQIAYYDREEQTPTSPPGDNDFSPRPPTVVVSGPALCWEVSVFEWDDEAVAGDGVLGSELVSNFVSDFENGWGIVNFTDVDNVISGADNGPATTNTFEGLPVVGFSATQFINANTDGTGTLGNFTGLFNHKATRSIVQS